MTLKTITVGKSFKKTVASRHEGLTDYTSVEPSVELTVELEEGDDEKIVMDDLWNRINFNLALQVSLDPEWMRSNSKNQFDYVTNMIKRRSESFDPVVEEKGKDDNS